jgi:hypothetical protein
MLILAVFQSEVRHLRGAEKEKGQVSKVRSCSDLELPRRARKSARTVGLTEPGEGRGLTCTPVGKLMVPSMEMP